LCSRDDEGLDIAHYKITWLGYYQDQKVWPQTLRLSCCRILIFNRIFYCLHDASVKHSGKLAIAMALLFHRNALNFHKNKPLAFQWAYNVCPFYLSLLWPSVKVFNCLVLISTEGLSSVGFLSINVGLVWGLFLKPLNKDLPNLKCWNRFYNWRQNSTSCELFPFTLKKGCVLLYMNEKEQPWYFVHNIA